MVNLTIRLNSKGSISGGTPGPSGTPGNADAAPRVFCGPHLVLADLPLASGVGIVPSVHSSVTVVNSLGQKVRRRPGDKVHFCVRCNFPIAIYGRLDPCEHVFCLICARKDATCYLCDERILRIQKLEVLDGIFVCGAAGCLRSYLSNSEFEWHLKDAHSDLLHSKEAPPSKPIDLPQTQQSMGQGGPSPSPSQVRPLSPPAHSRQEENPLFGSQAALQGQAEKQAKSQARDQLEPVPKRKRLEPQNSGAGREKEKEREREGGKPSQKDKDRDKDRDRDREYGSRDRDQSFKERDQSQRDGNRDKDRDRDRDRERDRDRDSKDRERERDRDRDRGREFQAQPQRDRDRELWEQQQHSQQQGGGHYPLPPPPPLPPPQFQSHIHQPERLGQVPAPQPGGALNSYPPQPFPPFHPQPQDNRNTPRYDSSRHGPFLDPRMTVPPDFQENNGRGRHMQPDGERGRNMPQQQEGFGPVMDRQGVILPHFHAEYGAPPMAMLMPHQGMNRFQDGGPGGGHLPPPPKRGSFVPGGDSGMVHPQLMFGWGVPGFGGGPAHPQFMNWQPQQ